MTPETLWELGKAIGMPAALLAYIWMNRAPAAKDNRQPSAEDIEAIRDGINRLEGKVDILLDRGNRK